MALVTLQLGILGGTFDPIHVGHLLIAEIARETLGLDRVLFVPAAEPPHKQGLRKTAAHHRRRMVELAIAGNTFFELCLFDLERPGPHYSIDTVRGIRAQHQLSADACYFIIGSDSLGDLNSTDRLEAGEFLGLLESSAHCTTSAAVVWIGTSSFSTRFR